MKWADPSRPPLGMGGGVKCNMIPLSEDIKLALSSPRELIVLPGETNNCDEVTTIGRGERRAISLDIRVAAGGRGEMIRIFEVPQGARLTIYHQVTVEAGGHWRNVICVRGRGEVNIRRALNLSGPKAEAALVCLAVMDQTGRISVADEMFSLAPETKALLRTKIVLNDGARSEARGRIIVGETSTKSESFEKLDHMVFGDQATVAAIPELEVMTDDVKCGHGATTSRAGEKELFYLTSRGLPLAAAQKLVAKGFIAEALADLPERAQQKAIEVMFG